MHAVRLKIDSTGENICLLPIAAVAEFSHCRPIYNSFPEARLALANHLVALPCALVHGVDSDCSMPGRPLAVSTIPVCLRVATCMLDGSVAEVTPAVRRTVYEAVGRSARHHSTGFGGRRLEHAAEIINVGMKDTDRSVRLSAG